MTEVFRLNCLTSPIESIPEAAYKSAKGREKIGETDTSIGLEAEVVTFFDAWLSRGTSGVDSWVLVSQVGSGIRQDGGSGRFSGWANGSGKGD
jgi:hypothetical protein